MEPKTNFFEKFWYLFVILAVVLVGVIFGLWISNKQAALRISQITPPVEQLTPTPLPEAAEIDQQTATLENQQASDEISPIEADIQATDLTGIDKELTDIEAEISPP